jgi:hypothetical protein
MSPIVAEAQPPRRQLIRLFGLMFATAAAAILSGGLVFAADQTLGKGLALAVALLNAWISGGFFILHGYRKLLLDYESGHSADPPERAALVARMREYATRNRDLWAVGGVIVAVVMAIAQVVSIITS